MPRTRVRVPFTDLGGTGLNEDESPTALKANELRVARNVYLEGAALSSRKGAQRFQSSAINSGAAGNGVWELVRSSGASRDILSVFGSKLYKDSKTTTPTDITGAITITAGQDNHGTFTPFHDTAFMCNGVDAPWKWDGAGDAAVVAGSPPGFRTMGGEGNRLL